MSSLVMKVMLSTWTPLDSMTIKVSHLRDKDGVHHQRSEKTCGCHCPYGETTFLGAASNGAQRCEKRNAVWVWYGMVRASLSHYDEEYDHQGKDRAYNGIR